MKTTFYSNGKLLITGEYLVLDGAKAFALPTKFGQNLIVENGSNKEIEWQSYDFDENLWFQNTISFSEIIANIPVQIETVKSTLVNILHEAYLLNPDFINKAEGYKISTQLTFPKNWGLGTSSTLLNNIAQWTNINAFTLLKNSFGGSGYDIACAQNNTPIIYRLDQQNSPTVETINFSPDFTKNIHFVYLNKKQNSKAAINAYYNNKNQNLAHNIIDNDKITEAVLKAENLKEFAFALEKHEIHLSNILELETIKEIAFPDFSGVVKSLGAWGGDFVMVVSKENPKEYFTSKGYETILTYDEMILQN
ncbi:mevalonate kinase [Flavobacterium sp. 90]|uniref:GYDIA family GHMP kinase n=1 Tax=unclassified Flavobacterium TaxID=196869 RepID=UPI000EB02D13|nr:MULTISPECIES: GYDIA family GHMP kinase [unclassified Flavobacterium]RKR09767.1 mevalonate kinase [Flavobacterium sp. 81]TCK53553.1 mevalonate kinase [Flavobacterium sp. 90]